LVIDYTTRIASENIIFVHLSHCDNNFIPTLGSRVEIADYARKIANKTVCFEAWVKGDLVGLVAVYCNNPLMDVAFITSVSVLSEFQGRGIASRLLANCKAHVRKLGFTFIELEVSSINKAASDLYLKHGFIIMSQTCTLQKMRNKLRKEIP